MPQDAKDIQFTELKDMVSQLNTTIAALTGAIREKDAAIAKLTEEVSCLRKKLFGASSEKRPDTDPNQLSLFDAEEGMEIPVADAEEVPETVVKEHTRQRKKKPTLEEQFGGATVNRVVADSLTEEEKQCPACGTKMVPIGTEVIRREVEFIPAKYEVTEYVATTYECPQCKQTEDPQFVKDEGCPPALIEKSCATPSLVAGILKNKFGLSLPFYRQEQDLKRSGIHGRLDHPCVSAVFPVPNAVFPPGTAEKAVSDDGRDTRPGAEGAGQEAAVKVLHMADAFRGGRPAAPAPVPVFPDTERG